MANQIPKRHVHPSPLQVTLPIYTELFVLDVNDNAPKFENLPYTAEVKEVTIIRPFMNICECLWCMNADVKEAELEV